MKRRLLWVGDAACQTGFARCTHETLEVLKETWDVVVLGLNYKGDPHEYGYPFQPLPTYPIWPAPAGGDWLGVNRLAKMIRRLQPHLIVIQNDPWNFQHYYKEGIPEHIPLVGAVAIDGKNCRGEQLNPCDMAVFWTQFALDEARLGGFEKRGAVVGLGVDTDFWTPGDRAEARQFIYENDYDELKDAFIVLNVNRNNPRKRMDLTLRYFGEWVRRYRIDDAYLHLHVAPTGDTTGFDIDHLAKYYGIAKKTIWANLAPGAGITDEALRSVYRAADLGLSTTQGEGWGLPAMEGMACGLAHILPDWSAYGEWATAARLIPCTSTCATWRSSVIGGIPDEEMCIQALHEMYLSREAREKNARDCYELVQQPQYRWRAVGEAFRDELDALVGSTSEKEAEAATV